VTKETSASGSATGVSSAATAPSAPPPHHALRIGRRNLGGELGDREGQIATMRTSCEPASSRSPMRVESKIESVDAFTLGSTTGGSLSLLRVVGAARSPSWPERLDVLRMVAKLVSPSSEAKMAPPIRAALAQKPVRMVPLATERRRGAGR